MKRLVISSCTSDKLNCEAPAAKMYTGLQHRYLMEGLEQVWHVHGRQTIDLALFPRSMVCSGNATLLFPTMKHFKVERNETSWSAVIAFKFMNGRFN